MTLEDPIDPTDPVDPADTSVQRLLALLELERVDRDLFRAAAGGAWPTGRLFGGQVAAQALRAAANTVDIDHFVHSMHGYFLRPGSPKTPVLFHVDRIRDGQSFTTRRVVAVQEGEAIFTLSTSFHKHEPGAEYQVPIPQGVPDPTSATEWYESPLARFGKSGPFDVREMKPTPRDERGAIETTRRVWLRIRQPLGDDPALHACILTFVSDMGAVYAAAIPVGGRLDNIMGASLDHSVWFHRPVRLDDWVLYDLRPISNAGSRGLVQGTFHTRDGACVASVAQEALIRPLK
ncbi:MAG: acyl-CoA thioesterase [Actinomycetia bacterium]|nr:acyl-CoA thioesterase [Actinomycetes bacterium]